MCRSILVPLDGSAFSEHALPLALALVRRSGAQLHLAHVLQPRGGKADAVGQATALSRATYLERVAQQLARVSNRAPLTAVLNGPVAETLLDHARAVRCDLLVLTTHGRGALSRLWLGSIADDMVRRSPTPVILVRPHDGVSDSVMTERLFRRMLIPLDGSPLAEAIIAHCVQIGRIMDAQYSLLRVVDPSALGLPHGEQVSSDSAAIQPLRDRAQAYLDRQVEELRAQGLSADGTVVVGEPSAAILSHARMHSMDIIAMATHGRGGFSRLLLGSVADKVLRGSSIPLLLYSPGAHG